MPNTSEDMGFDSIDGVRRDHGQPIRQAGGLIARLFKGDDEKKRMEKRVNEIMSQLKDFMDRVSASDGNNIKMIEFDVALNLVPDEKRISGPIIISTSSSSSEIEEFGPRNISSSEENVLRTFLQEKLNQGQCPSLKTVATELRRLRREEAMKRASIKIPFFGK